MQNIQVLVLSLTVVLAVLQSCYGLSCHQCDTYLSTKEVPTCIDPYTFGEENLDSCEDDDTHCVKMKTMATQVDTEDGGLLKKVVISRFCVNMKDKPETCYGKVGAGAVSLTCYCQTDGCNSGPIHKQHFTAVAMTTFLSIVLTSIFLGTST